jgi:hypothetical protein
MSRYALWMLGYAAVLRDLLPGDRLWFGATFTIEEGANHWFSFLHSHASARAGPSRWQAL